MKKGNEKLFNLQQKNYMRIELRGYGAELGFGEVEQNIVDYLKNRKKFFTQTEEEKGNILAEVFDGDASINYGSEGRIDIRSYFEYNEKLWVQGPWLDTSLLRVDLKKYNDSAWTEVFSTDKVKTCGANISYRVGGEMETGKYYLEFTEEGKGKWLSKYYSFTGEFDEHNLTLSVVRSPSGFICDDVEYLGAQDEDGIEEEEDEIKFIGGSLRLVNRNA